MTLSDNIIGCYQIKRNDKEVIMSDSQARLTILLEANFKQEIRKASIDFERLNDGYVEILKLGLKALKEKNQKG